MAAATGGCAAASEAAPECGFMILSRLDRAGEAPAAKTVSR